MRRKKSAKTLDAIPLSAAQPANAADALPAPASTKATTTYAPVRITLGKSNAGATRANLKNAYAAFLRASKQAGTDASSIPTPSEQWPRRPYAASI